MIFKYKQIASAVLLASLGLSAMAANYFYVQPKSSEMSKSSPISVVLNPATLPQARMAELYNVSGFDFKPQLAVTGDAGFNASQATFSLASGSVLPAGLSISATGVLTGTPTALTSGSSFIIQADYKMKIGQQSYSIVVANSQLGVGDGVSKQGACASGEATGCATFDPASISPDRVSLSANFLVSTSLTNHSDSRINTCKSTGKWYWEFTELVDGGNPHSGYGLLPAGATAPYGYPGLVTGGWALQGISGMVNGTTPAGVVSNPGAMPGLSAGQTLGIALDLDGRTATFIKDGSTSVTVPLLSTGAYCGTAGYMHLAKSALNAGQSTFAYPVPPGFNRGLW